MNSPLRIIVTGLIAQHPSLGGVTWDYLQYVVGLARLGHDVYYLEDSGEWPYTPAGGASGKEWVAYDCAPNVAHLASTMARFGLADKWAYRFPIKPKWYGLSPRERKQVIESADLLLNVSGTLQRPQEYRRVPCLAYLDSDPVFTQIKLKLAQGQKTFQTRLAAHDVHFSFGECITDLVPATRRRWRTTRQPVVLSEWRPLTARRDVFTTVTSWASYKPLVYRGHTFGQKDVEFKRFLDLPSKLPHVALEVALAGIPHLEWQAGEEGLPPGVLTPDDAHQPETPAELLRGRGWRVVDPDQVCPDLDRYREYIEGSKAEWSVAKNGYVRGQPGWFSCRSACYLAAGRPVVVQETGFSGVLPVGEGIVPFTTLEEAVSAIQEAEGNYLRHAKAARAIAEEYFDSAKVLGRLIEESLNGNG